MNNTDEKIKIIDEISKRHPSYGVDKGWSCYTGGMADTGSWYFRKMLDVPLAELLSFLNDIIAKENEIKIEKIFTEEEKKDMKIFHTANGITYSEYFIKQFRKLHQDIESKFFFGK